MPNYLAPSDTHFNNINDLSEWIIQLLILELNDNNPVTTELIYNYINNYSYNSPSYINNPSSYINNPSSSPTTIIFDHDDDQYLYESDSDSMPPLIDDYSDSFSGFTHPFSEG